MFFIIFVIVYQLYQPIFFAFFKTAANTIPDFFSFLTVEKKHKRDFISTIVSIDI